MMVGCQPYSNPNPAAQAPVWLSEKCGYPAWLLISCNFMQLSSKMISVVAIPLSRYYSVYNLGLSVEI